jgi:VanZ family protein
VIRPLRFASLWIGLGVVFLLVGVVLALLPIALPGPLRLSDKLLHLTAFLACTIWFSGIFVRQAGLRVAFALFLYGLLIEWLQSLTRYRFAETIDVMFNVGGIGAGWLLARVGLGSWCEKLESWLSADRPA